MPYHLGWGNPLNELIGQENKTCKGCIHQRSEKAFGIMVNYCLKGKKKMFRCSLYNDKKEPI